MLKPFQQEGARFLAARTRALLADEPGVGKTGQLITACNLVGARRVQVVCPSIGIEHWRRECEKWGLQADVGVMAWDDAHDWRSASPRLPDPYKPLWDVIIPDESHFGKNPQAKRTKAVFGTGGLGWYARRIWAASGTPAPNNAAELWPIMRAFGKTKMDQDTFTRYFCEVDQAGKPRRNRADHIAELRAILKSFSLRRLKKDVMPELGPIDVQDWYVTPSARFTFDVIPDGEQVERRLRGLSDDDVLALLADPSEDIATLRRYNALLKAPAIFDAVRFEIENGLLDKVVIYGYHVDAMEALHRNFGWAGIQSVLITGKETDAERRTRDRRIEEWRRSKKPAVLIASITIAGTVLDFTCAHQGIMLELDYVPGNNSQAMQRMHRHGQDKSVTVRVATGTPVDEIVNGVLIRKMKDLDEIFS